MLYNVPPPRKCRGFEALGPIRCFFVRQRGRWISAIGMLAPFSGQTDCVASSCFTHWKILNAMQTAMASKVCVGRGAIRPMAVAMPKGGPSAGIKVRTSPRWAMC